MRQSNAVYGLLVPKQSTDVSLPSNVDTAAGPISVGFFGKFAAGGSPFDIQVDDEESEDVLEENGVIRVCVQVIVMIFIDKICPVVHITSLPRGAHSS